MTKVALITGAARGIGAATCEKFKKTGHDWKLLTPARDDLNLSSYYSVMAYLEIVGAGIERLDALVLNAGTWKTDLTRETFEEQFKVHVISNWMIINHFLPVLERSNGCVIAVSSNRGIIGGVGCAAYSAAKAALVNVIVGYARDVKGVRFNAVCPGWTDTNMGKEVKASGGVSNPTAMPQSPDAVADVIMEMVYGGAKGQVVIVANGVRRGVDFDQFSRKPEIER